MRANMDTPMTEPTPTNECISTYNAAIDSEKGIQEQISDDGESLKNLLGDHLASEGRMILSETLDHIISLYLSNPDDEELLSLELSDEANNILASIAVLIKKYEDAEGISEAASKEMLSCINDDDKTKLETYFPPDSLKN